MLLRCCEELCAEQGCVWFHRTACAMTWGPAAESTWSGSDATRPATSRTSSSEGKFCRRRLQRRSLSCLPLPLSGSVGLSVSLSLPLCSIKKWAVFFIFFFWGGGAEEGLAYVLFSVSLIVGSGLTFWCITLQVHRNAKRSAANVSRDSSRQVVWAHTESLVSSPSTLSLSLCVRVCVCVCVWHIPILLLVFTICSQRCIVGVFVCFFYFPFVSGLWTAWCMYDICFKTLQSTC